MFLPLNSLANDSPLISLIIVFYVPSLVSVFCRSARFLRSSYARYEAWSGVIYSFTICQTLNQMNVASFFFRCVQKKRRRTINWNSTITFVTNAEREKCNYTILLMTFIAVLVVAAKRKISIATCVRLMFFTVRFTHFVFPLRKH